MSLHSVVQAAIKADPATFIQAAVLCQLRGEDHCIVYLPETDKVFVGPTRSIRDWIQTDSDLTVALSQIEQAAAEQVKAGRYPLIALTTAEFSVLGYHPENPE